MITLKTSKGKKLDKKKEEQTEKTLSYALNITANYYRIAAMKLLKGNFPNSPLTPEQFGILMILAKWDGLYQKQIADFLSKDRPNITRMLNILEEKNYVERRSDKTNKRISRVFITKRGLELVEKLAPFKEKLQKVAIQGISPQELEVLYELLSKMRENLTNSFNIHKI